MKDYSFIWWMFTVFGIPVAFPWVIYHLINKIRKGQQKSALNKQVFNILLCIENIATYLYTMNMWNFLF